MTFFKPDPEADCLILDGHAIIQQLPEPTSVDVIFSDMACKFMYHVLHLIKSATHTQVKCGDYKGSTVQAILPGRKILKWKGFLLR